MKPMKVALCLVILVSNFIFTFFQQKLFTVRFLNGCKPCFIEVDSFCKRQRRSHKAHPNSPVQTNATGSRIHRFAIHLWKILKARKIQYFTIIPRIRHTKPFEKLVPTFLRALFANMGRVSQRYNAWLEFFISSTSNSPGLNSLITIWFGQFVSLTTWSAVLWFTGDAREDLSLSAGLRSRFMCNFKRVNHDISR